MKGQISFIVKRAYDNFSGGGGATCGVEKAFGRPVDGAVNHNMWAILMHKTNHPWTKHYQDDVFSVDLKEMTEGCPVGLVWFSPDCRHFSRAKGDVPVDRKIRGLSWVELKWGMEVQPDVMMMENVKEIQTWGPLIQNEKGEWFPDPERAGETFEGFIRMLSTGIEPDHPAFLEACEFLEIEPDGDKAQMLIKGLGYDIDYNELKACDYGAPTIRERFFMVARRDGRKIVWPKPTHGPGLKPYRSAAEIIDWERPIPSIFETSEEIKRKHGVDARRPLKNKTMRRIGRGLKKFIIENKDPYILPWTVSNVTNATGHRVNEPVDTIRTGGGGGQMLIAPSLIQYHDETAKDEVRGQSLDKPLMTVDASNRYGLTAAFMTEYYGNAQDGISVKEPLHTVTSRDREGVTVAFMSQFNTKAGYGNSVDGPLNTVTAVDHNAIVMAYMSKFYGTGTGQDLRKPLATITTSPGHFGLIEVKLVKTVSGQSLHHWPEVRKMLNDYCGYSLKDDEVLIFNIGGVWYFISDIGLRMLAPRELYDAQGFPADYIIDRDYMGRPYPKSEQIARCGNSVSPLVVEALVRANLPELCSKKRFKTMKELEKEFAA